MDKVVQESVSPAPSKTQALERQILPKYCWRNWFWPCTSAHQLAAAEIWSQGAALDWGSSPAATSCAKPPLLQLASTLPDGIPENSQWVKSGEEKVRSTNPSVQLSCKRGVSGRQQQPKSTTLTWESSNPWLAHSSSPAAYYLHGNRNVILKAPKIPADLAFSHWTVSALPGGLYF